MVYINISMIAPCGINCSVCIAYLRDKNKCPGCNSTGDNEKPSSCVKCIVKNCKAKKKYCFECRDLPCKRMKQLDKRYRLKYATSPIHNLEEIQKNGIRKFIAGETKRWMCPHCGNTLSMHRNVCLKCNEKIVIEPNFEEKEGVEL